MNHKSQGLNCKVIVNMSTTELQRINSAKKENLKFLYLKWDLI